MYRAYRTPAGDRHPSSPVLGPFCIGLDWEGALGLAMIRIIDGAHALEATAYQGALRIVGDIPRPALVVLE